MANAALFYSPSLATRQLITLVTQASIMRGSVSADEDRLDFDETGGDVDRELAIPFLPNMDDVLVDAARLELRSVARDMEIAGYRVTQTSGTNAGQVVVLDTPARLRRVEISAPDFGGAPPADLHLVIRPATPQGSGFAFGPPIFADPPFSLPSDLYGPILGGLQVIIRADGSQQIALPNPLGPAWLIQFATGTEATELAPVSPSFQVLRVVISAAPRNLALTIPSTAEPVGLWSYPNALLPENGAQEVSFTPIAQNLLAQRRTELAPGQVTLPVPLRFHADSGGTLAVRAQTLTARYLVRPLGAEAQTLALRGDWTPLVLNAPAGLRPESGVAQLTARLLGRELNAGSNLPPLVAPGAGALVSQTRSAAVALPFLPLPGAAAGSVLPLVSARLFLQALDDAEVALEIRADTGGGPGAVTAGPIVRRLAPGPAGWVEFELPQPLPVAAGLAPVWLALRSTKGLILWHGQNDGSALGSADRGASWGPPDQALGPVRTLLAQLFHAMPDPQPRPVLSLFDGTTPLAADLLADAQPSVADPREYSRADVALPAAALNRLAASSGSGRVNTRLLLFSRAAMDLTLTGMTLFYSPFA